MGLGNFNFNIDSNITLDKLYDDANHRKILDLFTDCGNKVLTIIINSVKRCLINLL